MAKFNDVTMGQTEAVVNRMGGYEVWKRFAGGAGRIVFDLLTLLRTVKVDAQSAATTSAEYFAEAEVKSMGDNFKTQFLGLEVGATEEAELAVRKLEQNSLDAPIMAELGDRTEVSVLQMKAFLAVNRGSSEWFIFYLRGKDGNLWAVYACWYSGLEGWCVVAGSVGYPSGWRAGDRVVSRN